MDRKTFILKTSSILLISLPTYYLLGCTSFADDISIPDASLNLDPCPMGNCFQNGTNISISENHGHS